MSEVAAFKDVASLAYMNALTDKEKGQAGIYNVTIDDIIEELTKSYNITTIENGTVELATSDEDTNIELLAGETINKRVITSKDSTTNYVELKGKYYKFYLKNGKIEVDEGLKERPNATNDYSFTATSSDESLARVTVTPESTSNFTIQISGEGKTTSGSPAIITVSYGGSSVQINVTVKACNLLVTSESAIKGTVAVTSDPTSIGTNKYKKGTSVTIEATENTGYIFSGWYRVTEENENITESLISSENPYTFTIENENDTIKAKYNEATLIQGFVDDLGTRAMIYLYANSYANEEGDTITIKDTSNNNLVDVDGTSRTTIKAVAKNTNTDGKFEITGTSYSDAKKYYIAYPVTQNGEYTFNATKTKNGVTSNSTITVSVENIERFTAIETLATNQSLTSEDNGQKSYNYKGAAVPKGYYVCTNSEVDTGLVITDSIDSNGYSTGNEWVWVPVVEDSNYQYHLTVNPAEGMYGATSVTYTNYSKLWNFTTNKSENKTIFEQLNYLTAPSSGWGNSEPSVLINERGQSWQNDSYNCNNVYNRTSSTSASRVKFSYRDLSSFATQLRNDYNNMVTSLNQYKGFYIGRYEMTEYGEKPGISITKKKWYELYNECMFLNKGTNTETSMIYGTLWDATMKWLADANYNVGKLGESTCGFGNYGCEKISVVSFDRNTAIIVKPDNSNQILKTGQTSYTNSNNIYDLAGNCYDWTQEANSDDDRVKRGYCYYAYGGDVACPSDRQTDNPWYSSDCLATRAQLYIK